MDSACSCFILLGAVGLLLSAVSKYLKTVLKVMTEQSKREQMITGRVSGETTGLKIPFNCPDVPGEGRAGSTVSHLMKGSASKPDLHLYLWDNLQGTLP